MRERARFLFMESFEGMHCVVVAQRESSSVVVN